VSVYVRSTGEFHSLERANATHQEQVSRGVLFSSKPKAHQVKTSRGSSVQYKRTKWAIKNKKRGARKHKNSNIYKYL